MTEKVRTWLISEEGFDKLANWIDSKNIHLRARLPCWTSIQAASYATGLEDDYLPYYLENRHYKDEKLEGWLYPFKDKLVRYFDYFEHLKRTAEPYYYINELIELGYWIYKPILDEVVKKFKREAATDNELLNYYPNLAKHCGFKLEIIKQEEQVSKGEEKEPRGTLAILYVLIQHIAGSNKALISENGNPNMSEIYKRLNALVLNNSGKVMCQHLLGHIIKQLFELPRILQVINNH